MDLATQQSRAEHLAALHVKGDPLVLYNVWDAGSARAVRDAGARAIATGSWSVAAAHGYEDGEQIPFNLVVGNIERIASSIDLPLTVDLEGGYAVGGPQLEENIERVVRAGAVGMNFEDQRIGQGTMYSREEQSERIAEARAGAARAHVPMFINARTDLFLKSDPAEHERHVDEAIARAHAYADAGASGLFVPGLRVDTLISRICAESPIPVNVMFLPTLSPTARLAELGVARISHGPRPYREMIRALTAEARHISTASTPRQP